MVADPTAPEPVETSSRVWVVVAVAFVWLVVGVALVGVLLRGRLDDAAVPVDTVAERVEAVADGGSSDLAEAVASVACAGMEGSADDLGSFVEAVADDDLDIDREQATFDSFLARSAVVRLVAGGHLAELQSSREDGAWCLHAIEVSLDEEDDEE